MTSLLHPTAYQLGDLLNTYRYSRSAATWLRIRLALILFGGLVLIIAGVASSNADIRFLAGLGVLWIPLSILAIAEWRRKHNFCVMVYQAGLVYSRPREMIAIRWEEITAIIQQHMRSTLNGVPLGMFYTFIIHTATGRSFKLTNAVEDIALLGAHIEQATFPYLYSQALMRYQQGETIAFGKLGIGPAGLQIRQKTLSWPHLRDIMVQDGSVRIRQHGKWLAWRSVAIADVANIHVALPLIEEISASQKSADSY
jgi:Family of unknown function (DUF6585)